jgi:hypothetical protein
VSAHDRRVRQGQRRQDRLSRVRQAYGAVKEAADRADGLLEFVEGIICSLVRYDAYTSIVFLG